jgi:hypothetical protein
MPDLSQSAPMSFIIETILVIFAVVGIGIVAVKRAKKAKDDA